MVDERTFLTNVAASPDDDFPRLVFADWLEEQGDPWAQVIRWQCEAARYQPLDNHSTVDLRWRALDSLAKGVLKQLIREGRFTPITRLGAHFGPDSFRRGMPEKVSIDAEKLCNFGQELADAAPALRAIKLRLTPGFPLNQLHECPALYQINELDLTITPRQTKWDLEAIHQSRWAQEIQHLTLQSRLQTNSILQGFVDGTGFGLQILTESEICQNLRSLNLAGTHLGERELQLLSRNCSFPNLLQLNLRNNQIRLGALEEFATSGAWRNLQSLNLGTNHFVAYNWRENRFELAALPSLLRFPNLTRLNLKNNADSTPYRNLSPLLQNFWETPGKHAIESLNLAENGLTIDALGVITRREPVAGQFPHLTRLDLSGNQITGQDFQSLFAAEGGRNLRWLSLRKNRIALDGLKELSRLPQNEKLEWLDLSANDLHPLAANRLARSPVLSGLTYLNLAQNKLRDDGVHRMANSSLFANLEVLSLSQNHFGSRGIRSLIESPTLNKLRFLFLQDLEITAAQLDALRERFGPFVFCTPLT